MKPSLLLITVSTLTVLLCVPGVRALDPSLDVSQYAHTAWKVRDGFTTGSITSVAQTPDGYLWVGTEFGLFRFDGVSATPWHPADRQLPGDNIEALLAARDGALWIGTHAGVSRWKNGKLTTYPELAGHIVLDLREGRDGTVWAGGISFPGPGKLCAIGTTAVRCYGEDGSFGVGPTDLYEDSRGNLWAGVQSGMWRWTPGPPEHFSVHPQSGGIRTFVEDNDGALLIASVKQIQRFVNGRIEEYPLPGFSGDFQTQRMLRDREGDLWIGTLDRGLLHLHRGKTDAFSKTDGLSGDRVYGIMEDREGNIWVATQDGLDRFRDHAVSNLSEKQGLSNSVAWSVLAAEDGSIWIGNNNGLNRWNNSHMSLFGAAKSAQRANGRSNGLVPNSLFQDSTGRIWVSTHEGIGYLENGRFLAIPGVPAGDARDIVELGPGHLWIAHQQAGLLHCDHEKLIEDLPWAKLGYQDFALALAADTSHNGLWLGFFKGGIAYVADGQVRASYSVAEGLGRGRVNGLRFGPRGTLWAATEGGLSRIKDGHIRTLTSKNGLPCDSVTWSMEDDDHSVWLYMPCGLARITRSELDSWVADPTRAVKTTVLGISDGVRGHSLPSGYGPRVTKSADGKI